MLPQDKIEQETPSLVEQTLAAHGYWDPVRYLLTIGRISQQAYEAWHLGELASLEEGFSGSPKRIKNMLDVAMLYVEKRQLRRVPKTWSAWGEHAGKHLLLFTNQALHQHFSWSFEPEADRPQLDLFMDAPHIVCFNRIRTALAQQSPQLQAMFDDAFEDYANDPTLTRLEALFVAEQHITHDIHAQFTYYQQEIFPLAQAEFAGNKQDMTDFLSPLWRNLALQLQQHPFDPKQPHVHAATAYLEAKAYAQVIQAVEQHESWSHIPLFHQYLIQSQAALHHIPALRAAWFNFCLHCPNQAQKVIHNSAYNQALQAAGLEHLYHNFSKLTHQPSIEDFPAWVLIQQSEYLASLPDMPIAQHEAGQRLLWVKALLGESSNSPQIQLRRQLQVSSAWLFSMLLKKRPGIF